MGDFMLFKLSNDLSIDLRQTPIFHFHLDTSDASFYLLEIGSSKVCRIHMTKARELMDAIEKCRLAGSHHYYLLPNAIINLDVITAVSVVNDTLCVTYPGGSWVGKNIETVQGAYRDYLKYTGKTSKDSAFDDKGAVVTPPPDKKSSYKIDDKTFEALLRDWGRDLTDEAKRGLLQPIVGREKEIAEIQAVLLQKEKGNPILLGEAGVGKTAIVEHLAQVISAGKAPAKLANARVILLNLSSMDNSKWKGEFQGKLFPLLNGVLERNQNGENIILFVDEFHSGMDAGASSNEPSVAEYLKPYLTNPYFRMIAATTQAEYQEHVVRNQALNRRFQPVTIGEPDEKSVLAILEGRRTGFEKHYGISIPAGSAKYFYDMTQKLLPNSFQPDKSIAAMDNACSRAVMKGAKALEAGHAEESLASMSGLPTDFFKQEENARYRALADTLKTRVFGQDQALEEVAQIIKRGRVNLSGANRPLASILLKGPNGTGKSETGYALAEALCGGKDKAIVLDMSAYADGYDAKYKLLGISTAHAGDGREGDLTGPVRRNPSSVIILKNIDKTSPQAIDIIQRVISAGEIKDAAGKKVSFRNTVILMSGNEGSEKLFTNVSDSVQYQPLTAEANQRILGREWNSLQEKVKARWKLNLSISTGALEDVLAVAATNTNNRAGKAAMGFAGAAAATSYNGRAVVSAFEAALTGPLSEWFITQDRPRDAFNRVASINDNLRAVTITGVGKNFGVAEKKPVAKPEKSLVPMARC